MSGQTIIRIPSHKTEIRYGSHVEPLQEPSTKSDRSEGLAQQLVEVPKSEIDEKRKASGH
jgi:hypothetical protein